MEGWSILSDHVKYVKHDDRLETFHMLNVNPKLMPVQRPVSGIEGKRNTHGRCRFWQQPKEVKI